MSLSLIYQYIFLNINDDSNFYFSNESFKSNRPKSKLKKKRKEKKALLILKCCNICPTTLVSSWPRCLCILSFKSKSPTRPVVIKLTSKALQVLSPGSPACPFSNQSLVYGVIIPPNQPAHHWWMPWIPSLIFLKQIQTNYSGRIKINITWLIFSNILLDS